MVNTKEIVDRVEAAIAGLPPKVQDVLNLVQAKTGVKRAYIGLGLSAFFALYMIIGYFAQFICNFVGFVIPAYASMRAIESTTKEDDTKWLTYWVVFALFSVVDFFADGILRYFPFYWLAKIVFLVYCFFPVRQNGSYVIYHRIIRPYFLKHQGAVDSAYQRAAAGVHAAGVDVASSGSQGNQNPKASVLRSFLNTL
uniref:Receptor expression-enhancing protein n=1 Tax=Ornithodoros turicata TaxID=34597 RepID=A0A2R5L4W7_9ACAR